jgi:hypothetical protein
MLDDLESSADTFLLVISMHRLITGWYFHRGRSCGGSGRIQETWSDMDSARE